MIYRFRIILDTKEDVFRDIEINESSSLEELHNSIIKSFGFLGNEMASFYKTDNDWKQGDELPLNDFGPETPSMKNKKLSDYINSKNKKLLYVYDFLNLWTFFIELMEVGEIRKGTIYPNLINSEGEVPEQPPEKNFNDGKNLSNDLGIEKNEDNFY